MLKRFMDFVRIFGKNIITGRQVQSIIYDFKYLNDEYWINQGGSWSICQKWQFVLMPSNT